MSNKRKKQEGLYKISDLSRETGVPTATIKFYLRQGLLPPATVKTGRNMAYYDHSFVDRIRFIKELQQKRFLPLDVIKAVLNRDGSVISPHEVDTLVGIEGKFYEEIRYAPGIEPVAYDAVPERFGLCLRNIDACIKMDVLTPIVRNGVRTFEGDDVRMLENFAALREAGLTSELLPYEQTMPAYVEAISKLVADELTFFTRAVTGKVDDAEVPRLALTGVKLGEKLIGLLRRKLILRAIQDLRSQSTAESSGTQQSLDANDARVGTQPGVDGGETRDEAR